MEDDLKKKAKKTIKSKQKNGKWKMTYIFLKRNTTLIFGKMEDDLKKNNATKNN